MNKKEAIKEYKRLTLGFYSRQEIREKGYREGRAGDWNDFVRSLWARKEISLKQYDSWKNPFKKGN